MAYFRRDTLSGSFGVDIAPHHHAEVQFTEWHNGEGMDFIITTGNHEQTYSLHEGDLAILYGVMKEFKFVNKENVNEVRRICKTANSNT